MFHYGLRATHAETTVNFYTRVLGMVVDQTRPKIGISGYWLRAALPGSPPSIHVFTGDDARVKPADTQVPTGSGAVHHISLYCVDYSALRRRLLEYGLKWEGGAVPGGKQWVIFVYDPNGVMLELTFDASIEEGPVPDIPAENTYMPGAPFRPFDPMGYAMFAG
ncbi:VOC family protein [Variovorax sp. dw_954]|uniref:VOC family protein n=1 Tax=Variovorax sp. dw_954 TaxID=2720078 RepID=UPI001BD6194E|nr:VOC family protein [Variovorax sp. dw_954]